MADNSSLLTIKLNVYNTLFTVHTKREDEESYRKSAKLVTDLMNFYSEKFKGIKSEKDIQLMVMLDIAMRYEQTAGRNDTKPYIETLQTLTEEIESALNEETKTLQTE